MLTHGNQAGGQRHHWLATEIGTGRAIFQWRHAVKNDARTHPVKMRLWPQQNATRRSNRALARLAFAKSVKDIELFLGCTACGLISAGKVADDIYRLTHVFTLGQTMIKRPGLFWPDAQTVHTGIEFHPDGNRFIQVSLFQSRKLFFVMYGSMKMLRGNGRQVSGVKKTFE